MTFRPNDCIRFRIGPGEVYSVVSSDGVLVSFICEGELIHVPVGDICRAGQ